VLVLDAALAHRWPQLRRRAQPPVRPAAPRANPSQATQGNTSEANGGGSPGQSAQGQAGASHGSGEWGRGGGRGGGSKGGTPADTYLWSELRGRNRRQRQGLGMGGGAEGQRGGSELAVGYRLSPATCHHLLHMRSVTESYTAQSSVRCLIRQSCIVSTVMYGAVVEGSAHTADGACTPCLPRHHRTAPGSQCCPTRRSPSQSPRSRDRRLRPNRCQHPLPGNTSL